MAIKMTSYDYEFLTGTWEGVKGAAYNIVAEDCAEFGWFKGYNYGGTPNITERGHAAIKEFLDVK